MIDELIGQIEARHSELEGLMSDPAVIGDRERYAEVGRESVSYTHLTLPTTPYV